MLLLSEPCVVCFAQESFLLHHLLFAALLPCFRALRRSSKSVVPQENRLTLPKLRVFLALKEVLLRQDMMTTKAS